jgi:surfactin synthase thioesterase subunit
VNVPVEHIEAWREQTTGGFLMHVFSGGHFFLNDQRPELLEQLRRDLR